MPRKGQDSRIVVACNNCGKEKKIWPFKTKISSVFYCNHECKYATDRSTLTIPQEIIWDWILDQGVPLSPYDIARGTGYSWPNVKNTLLKLESLGLVESRWANLRKQVWEVVE